MIKAKPLLANLAIPLAVGGLAALLIAGYTDTYATLELPHLAPPGLVFPIVWTLLYLLMGVSAYGIWVEGRPRRPLVLYGVQLGVNFLWPLVFFRWGQYLPAFFLLVLLWCLVLAMILAFHKVRPWTAWLQVPYLLWITFASYLNLAVAILN